MDSSSLSVLDTAGWVRFSCSAARVKFMVWQTHKNVSNRGSISASITIIYRLIIKHNFLFRKTSAIIMSELSKNYLGRREAGAALEFSVEVRPL